MRDFTDDLRAQRSRLDEAAGYLKIGEARNRLVELESEMQRPDLWDDADWMAGIVRATADSLPQPKPKKPKASK